MPDTQLTMNEEERACLVELLENALKETRIEEHRTRAPAYREHVERREKLLIAVLDRLGRPT